MPDYRRAARELALRVLFQADVGQQPVREVIGGALDQLTASVRSGLTMAVRQAERRMGAAQDPPLVLVSQTTRRERTRVRRNVAKQLQAAADELAALVEQALQLHPSLTADEVLGRFDGVVAPSLRKAERILARALLPADEISGYEDCVREAVRAMRRTMEKRLPVARATADLLIRLAGGASRYREELARRLNVLTGEWPLDRQASADRNILRLAAFELLYCPETPPAVVINEAVELAKRYGTEESPRFVNGVLSALAAQEDRILPGGAP